MRILYLHQYYRTPLEGGGVRSYHVAKALAAKGHDVHVVTTWAGPVKRVMQEGGVKITYLPIAYDNTLKKADRIRAFWAFVWQSYQVAKTWKGADKVFATSTPLTIGLVALMLKYLHGIPYVFEVRDCWPEAPIQLGYVRNPLYQSVLRYLEKRIYKGAESIIALSVPMQAHVQKIAPKKTVKVIPNFADVEFFGDKAPDDAGLYHVVYAGTFGHANRIHRLLMLALEAHKAGLPVQFTLAGAGAERERAEAFVLQNNLVRSVKFLPHLSTYGVRDLLATADAAYVGFRQEPILESNSPNKFFDALAAGVPVLLGVKGWLADIVHLAECGEVLSDHATDLDGLNALMAKNQVQLQQAAREWAHRFDKNQLAQAVVSAIDHTEPVAAMVKDWVSLQEHS